MRSIILWKKYVMRMRSCLITGPYEAENVVHDGYSAVLCKSLLVYQGVDITFYCCYKEMGESTFWSYLSSLKQSEASGLQRSDYSVPGIRTRWDKAVFSFGIPQLDNKLPENLRCVKSVGSAKTQLKTCLLTKAFDQTNWLMNCLVH